MASNPNLHNTSSEKNSHKRSVRDNQISPTPDDYIARIDMLIKKVEQALEI